MRQVKPSNKSVKKLTLQAMLCIGLCAPAHAVAQKAAPRIWPIAAVDSALEQAREAWEIPGMAVAIVRGDSVLLAKGYGVRELGKPDRVDANTIFDAASLTKSFTSAAAAILVDEGKLRWDDPVRRHLPRLEFSNPYLTSEVTMRDLLSHRAGLESANSYWYFTNEPRDEVIRRVRFLQPRAAFRTALVYSNVGYTIAGEAVATAAGVPWDAFIRTRLLEPLGMTRTTSSFASAGIMSNVASPHAVIDGVQRPIAREGLARDATGPAGAVQSSVADLARWLRFQLNGGTLDGRRLVSEAALRETQSSQLVVPTTVAFRRARNLRYGAGYGMGWQVWDYRGRPMLWHTGSGDGELAYMAIFPENGLGIVVLVNSWVMTSVPPVHGMIAGCIADALLALAEPDCVGTARSQRAADANRWNEEVRAFEAARLPNTTPTKPIAAYAGTYVDSLYGTFHVRADSGRLVLQLGDRGEVADLTHWHLDTFLARWRRPFQRMYFSSRVTFALDADGNVGGLRMRLRNDEARANRVGSPR
jgi:CubicO group peptidase (beta-lactamase class C family)